MHLSSIRISGFKSFAEEVELRLEPGITTIVGPNGCGKSNVSDAIRWVLGEQSSRSLRCTNMRELLFNGGSNFQPSRRARVALSFTNISEKLSINTPEVEVCRELTRDGESSYLINKTPCRLRDISELFMDTGIGVDAYSVMEQSKIDLILNVRPEERRFLFDEVAGITKYKHRKKTALQKLKDAEQNLVRIKDVIEEIKRETEELRVQAEQAEHYQSLKEQLQQLELGLAYRGYEKLVTDIRETQNNLDEILNEVSDADQLMQTAEERVENATIRRSELDTELATSQNVIREISDRIEQVERQIVVYKEKQVNIRQQRERAAQTLESLKTRFTNLQTHKRERIQEKNKLEASLKIEESRLSGRKQVLQDLSTRIDEAKQTIQDRQTILQETVTELTQQENRQLAIEHKVSSTQSNIDRLQENIDGIKSELATATDHRAEIQREVTQIEAEMIQITSEKTKIETNLEENQNALRRIEAEIRGLQENLGVSLSRSKSLEQLQSAYEGYYAGVRAIMQAKELYPDRFSGVCGIVAELINTDSEYEIAIEVALGSAIQNIIVETAEDTVVGINYLKENRAGRVTFLPLDTLRNRRFTDDVLLDEPSVIGIAKDLVDFDPKYDKAVQHLLGNTLVIENLDDAIDLARRYRLNARLVTIEGELINTTGTITGGYTNQRQSGLLSRARELEVLKEKIGDLSKIVNQKDELRKSHASKIADFKQRRQKIVAELQDKQIEKTARAKDIEQSNENITRLETQLAKVETENKELQETVDLSSEERQKLATEIEELTKKRSQTERSIERINEQIESETSKQEEVASECQEWEIFLAGQRQKVESMVEELKNAEQEQVDIEKEIQKQQSVIDNDEQIRHDIAEQIDEAQRLFLQVEGDKAEAEAAYDELMEEQQSLNEQIESYQKEIRDTRRKYEKQNKRRHQLEVKKTQLEMQLKSISTRILEKYQVSIDDLPNPSTQVDNSDSSEQSSVPAFLELDEIDLMDNIEKLKAELSAMGAVNLKAIEAHGEHKKRLEFLESQRGDVEQSIQSTYQAIKKINETSREVFMKTFAQIQINFQEVFTQLFGGGETELRLTDETNILESGIEIIARPPGKRPQSITQLSGGERSLVAIGLLFAVFKIKPSPFCVLDEVDAALDEANILRFTNLIRAYSENTQFVIITHNNRTIEIADVMYGVTMEQAGMSKIVTFKFS